MTKKTILYLILVVAILATAFIWFNRSSKSLAVPGEEIVSGEFATRLSELRRLKEIRIDTAFLKDPFFQSLAIPSGVYLPPAATSAPDAAPPGRVNPFTPF